MLQGQGRCFSRVAPRSSWRVGAVPSAISRPSLMRSTRRLLASSALLRTAAVATRAPLLANFRVVLVGPSQPGNVGATARACGNFDCPDIALVMPEYDRSTEESGSYERRFAMQPHAKRLLELAPVYSSLEEALADCTAAVGFTRRRGMDRVESALPMAIDGLAELDNRHGGKVALVFGREASGLTSHELLLCTHACEIATSDVQPSISLPTAASMALGRTYESALLLRAQAPHQSEAAGTAAGAAAGVAEGVAAGVAAGVAPNAYRAERLRLATLQEIDRVMSRWEELATPALDRALDTHTRAHPIGGAAESEHAADGRMAGEAAGEAAGGAAGGAAGEASPGRVRTSRGTRATSGYARATTMIRRMLQRAQPTSREIRALHGALTALSSGLQRGRGEAED
jgi:tRNA C32,U32 (ribose-2'-O)-methylase TrmJ